MPIPLSKSAQVSSRSRFADRLWILDCALPTKPHVTLNWAFDLGKRGRFTDARFGEWLFQARAIMRLKMRGEFTKGSPLAATSAVREFTMLRQLIRWMAESGHSSFATLDIETIRKYRNYTRDRKAKKRGKGGAVVATDRKLGAASIKNALSIIYHILESGSRVTGVPKLPSSAVDDLLAKNTRLGARKSSTPRIPDHVFVNIMSASLVWLTEIAPLIFRVDAELRAIYKSSRNSKISAKRARAWRENNTDSWAVVHVHGQPVDLAALGQMERLKFLAHTCSAAYILLAGLTGMRCSELLSLTDDTLSSRRVSDQLVVLLLRGKLFKTAHARSGEPCVWVAGWDKPDSFVRLAIESLKRLQNRDQNPARLLFTPIAEHRRSKDEGVKANALLNRLTKFIVFNGVSDWKLRTHQFRKTFARFIALSSGDSLPALQGHYQHVSRQMTELYTELDPELLNDILDESSYATYDALETVLATNELGGLKGLDVIRRRGSRRRLNHQQKDAIIRQVAADSSTRVVLHPYGVCIYQDGSGNCGGDVNNVGIKSCIDCRNFLVHAGHAAFWREHRRGLLGAIMEIGSPRSEQLVRELALTNEILQQLGGDANRGVLSDTEDAGENGWSE